MKWCITATNSECLDFSVILFSKSLDLPVHSQYQRHPRFVLLALFVFLPASPPCSLIDAMARPAWYPFLLNSK